MRNFKALILIALLGLILTGCQISFAPPGIAATETAQAQIILPPTTTIELTETPTMTPSPTPQIVNITASVWATMPKAPVLMYHHFDAQPGDQFSENKISLDEFDDHLNALYDAGFSLVSLEDWLAGTWKVPAGRRPLILSIDDLFFGDQLSLDDNGNPADYSGIGRLWSFSQFHPDFGFAAALFYNFGDKPYENNLSGGTFSVVDGWRRDRARAITWGIEHGAMPMNHFYTHPFLDTLTPEEIQAQLVDNDQALRDALALIGREDLAEVLPNILALPYLIWPETDAGKAVLFDYVSPEGKPVAGIVEGAYAGSAEFLPATFSSEFDWKHIPRLITDTAAIKILLDRLDELPTAEYCRLGSFALNPELDSEEVSEAILSKINSGKCPEGVYQVEDLAFQVRDGIITQFTP